MVYAYWSLIASAAYTCFFMGIFLLFWKIYREQYYALGSGWQQWLVHFSMRVQPLVRRVPRRKYGIWLQDLLIRADIDRLYEPDMVIGAQMVFAMTAFAFVTILTSLLIGFNFFGAMFVSLGVAIFPVLALWDRAQVRTLQCVRELPHQIDYLALTIDAGLNFREALDACIVDSSPSALRDELAKVARQMQLGKSQEDALQDFQSRMNTPSTRMFCQTLIQAIKTGTDLVQSMYVMADTLRSQRFIRAEEQAGKISVRMMIPMAVFVLPATMIILLGPIVIEWLETLV